MIRGNSLKLSPHILLIIVLIVAALLMYDRQFIQDDAFISFRYAQNFADGNGLVWYPGSEEFGYTNFLFTLMVGLLMKAGIGVPVAAFLISVPASIIALLFVYKIGQIISGTPLVGLLASAALATNHTYAAYATGGLETSLVLCLILGAYYHLLGWHQTSRHKYLWLMGVFSALALLTRLDSALLLFPGYVMFFSVLYRQYKQKIWSTSQAFDCSLKAVAIPILAVLFLLVLCLVLYGQFLPTTFYAKASRWEVLAGIKYLHTFLSAQYYMPVLLFCLWFYLVSAKDFVWKKWGYRFMLLGAFSLWLIYILRVGGDFMEFRFILPLLPFFYLLLFDLIVASAKKNRLAISAAFMMVLAGNIVQPYYFGASGIDKKFLESTAHLDRWITRPEYNWEIAGGKLREYFNTGSDSDVHISVTAAGAIPFYSGLQVIDQHGLNTRKILENPANFLLRRVGHRYKASLRYLKRTKVNLVIDHPVFVHKTKDKHGHTVYKCLQSRHLLTHKDLWDIPLLFILTNKNYFLLAHYLRPHPVVEKLIKKGIILPYSKVRRQTKCGEGLKKVLRKKVFKKGK